MKTLNRRKLLGGGLGVLSGNAAAQSGAAGGAADACVSEATKREENQRVVIEALEALSSANYEGYLGQLAENVRFYSIGREPRIGRDTVRQLLKRSTASIGPGGYREEILNIVAEGDVVAVQSRGHEKTKAGLDYNNEYLVFYTVRSGQIVETRSHMDTELTNRVKVPLNQP